MSIDRDAVRILADEIVDGVVHRRCPECKELKPLDEFGLRRVKQGASGGRDLLTNQSRCHKCR